MTRLFEFLTIVALWCAVILSIVLLAASPVAVFDPVDYGAIPNDGKDDSAAFLACYDAAMDAGGEVHVPTGVFDLMPMFDYVMADLVVKGKGRYKSVLRRMVNQSWTQRFRCGDGASIRFEDIQLDGNARNLGNVPGDDQHHEIRIDRLQESTMDLVVLQGVGLRDPVADGVQFVHNGLKHVIVHDFEFLGGTKGRRNIQFSYHPKSAHVSDSRFYDFSTEPAGGSANRVNLVIEDCTTLGNCNLQECGDLQARRLSIGRLSSLTCDSGSAEDLDVASVGSIVGPSNIEVVDSLFRINAEPMKFWARFNRYKMDVTFRRCQFVASPLTQQFFAVNPPSSGSFPDAKIAFVECHFPSVPSGALHLGSGYDFRVQGCRFDGLGIVCNARFSPGGSLFEADNEFGQVAIQLAQVSSGSPFILSIEEATQAKVLGADPVWYPTEVRIDVAEPPIEE